MVRSVDIFIINGDSFINYCSDNDYRVKFLSVE